MDKIKHDKKHECTIILDTNQFIRDLSLSETRWKNLIDYIHKTDAVVKMPRVVWDEIGVNYKKRLNEHLRKAQESTEQFNSLINFQSEHHQFYGHLHRIEPPTTTLTSKELMERYLAFIKSKLQLKTHDFLEIENKWYEEIYKRSLIHQKPFSTENDKGFKDSILWKCVLSLSSRPGFKDAPIVLISSNTRDFCDGKPSLHPDLQKEAKTLGLDVHYFDGLDKFFQGWGAEALSINFEKLKRDIPEKLIKEALLTSTQKLMRRNENRPENILILGISFKIKEAAGNNKKLEMSISGSLTNTRSKCEYLDFSAEAIFCDDGINKQITIQQFTPQIETEKQAADSFTSFLSFDAD